MGNTLNYTTKVIEYGSRFLDGMTMTPVLDGTVADLKTVPVRFSLTFHDLDQETLDRILNAVNSGLPVK